MPSEGDTKSEGERQEYSPDPAPFDGASPQNGPAQENARDELPLRSELFRRDQMKRHGKALADSHKLSLGRASDRLLTLLAENEGVLIGACNLLTAAVKANRRIAPAGEWLLDNFYLIEEEVRGRGGPAHRLYPLR